MLKKIVFILFLLIVILLLAVFAPWERLSGLDNLLHIKKAEKYSSLKVYSLGGDMNVSIDGEEKGISNFDKSYLEITPISPGDHQVVLKRISTSDSFYTDFEKNIYFEEGFDVVISWEIGPSEESSSGWILSAEKYQENSIENSSYLIFSSAPENIDVKIDGTDIADTIDLSNRHLVVCSSPGYQNLEFEVLPEDEDSRLKLKDYKLELYVKLYKLPFTE